MVQPRSKFNLQNTLAAARTWVQQSGVLARPTMENPQFRLQTHGHADPNNHYQQGANAGPFSAFVESHMRQVRPPHFKPRG